MGVAPLSSILIGGIVLAVSIICYLGGYNSQRYLKFYQAQALKYIAGFVFWAVVIGILALFPGSPFAPVTEWLWVISLATFFPLALIGLIIIPEYLKSKQQLVRNIGIVATLIGILVQFLPPALDLLNIPVK